MNYNFNSNSIKSSNWSTSNSSKGNRFNLPNAIKRSLGINNSQYLNSGKFGAVYNTDDGVVKVTSSKNLEVLALEYDISLVAGENRIGPRIIKSKSGFVEHNGIHYLKLHMEKMNTTLMNYKKQNNVNGSSLYRQISQKVRELHEIGICHNDLHVKNIMSKNGNWYLIDFGKATYSENNACSKDVSKLGTLEYDLSKLVKSKNSNKNLNGLKQRLF